MAIGEAITNIAAARIEKIGDIKLSANWMAAAGHPGEDAALYDTVNAVGMELCPELGISIPVGKDSMSMKTRVGGRTGRGRNGHRAAVADHLRLRAVADARMTLTPQLRTDQGESDLILIDLGHGKSRLGGSALAQVYKQVGNDAPDVVVCEPAQGVFRHHSALNRDGRLLAYHDRSDGGLFVTLCEMMFAGHIGVTVDMDELCYEQIRDDVEQRGEEEPEIPTGSYSERIFPVLFNEELGAVLQVRRSDTSAVMQAFFDAGLRSEFHVIGSLNADDKLHIVRNESDVFSASRVELQRAWSETTYHMQSLRDNPDCARQEFDRILDAGRPRPAGTA